MSDEDWETLRVSVPRDAFMAAGVRAIPKVSKLGTRFFAHPAGSAPPGGRETPEHLLMKAEIVAGATAAGWEALPEQSGISPRGKAWKADVLCRTGSTQVVFEAQVSSQNEEEYAARQAVYNESGLRAMWLVAAREGAGVPSKDIPRLKVKLTRTGGATLATVVLGGGQEVPLREFVRGSLTRPGMLTWYEKTDEASIQLRLSVRRCSNCKKMLLLPYFGDTQDWYGVSLWELVDLIGFADGFKILQSRLAIVASLPTRYKRRLMSRCVVCSAMLDASLQSEACHVVPIGVRIPPRLNVSKHQGLTSYHGWYWGKKENIRDWAAIGTPSELVCQELIDKVIPGVVGTLL